MAPHFALVNHVTNDPFFLLARAGAAAALAHAFESRIPVIAYNAERRAAVKMRGWRTSGGFDLLAETIDAIAQGFLAVSQLYLYRASDGLLSPSDTDTGAKFVTRSNIAPYLTKGNGVLRYLRAAM
jgi:ABC-type sugar transport system substrate-binding protein